jgi:hypothetical protein
MKIPSGIPSAGHAAFWAFMPIHKCIFSRRDSARAQVGGEIQTTNQEGPTFTILAVWPSGDAKYLHGVSDMAAIQ